VKRELVVIIGAMLLSVPLQAQRPLTVTGMRGLTFGSVLAGVPRTILRTDPANSGQVDIKAPNNSLVLLTFVLPAAMTGPLGALLPLSFGAGDAGYSQAQTIGSQVGFDPRQPFNATLSNNGRASVFLGGTARPSAGQRAGAYTGTITLTVTLL
jgi:hypothetical protein